MTTNELLRLAINLHTRTVIRLLDSLDNGITEQQRRERLALIRDAVLEFKTDMTKIVSTS